MRRGLKFKNGFVELLELLFCASQDSPMRRGLKWEQHAPKLARADGASQDSPMRRGLKSHIHSFR